MASNPSSNSNTATSPPAGPPFLIKVSIPSLELQKTLRALPTDTVWDFKNQIVRKIRAENNIDTINFGVYLMGSDPSKSGKFLDEKRTIGAYHLTSDSPLQFCVKVRTTGQVEKSDKKKQKKFYDEVVNANYEKVQEMGWKGMDPNFWIDSGETPLSAAVLNDDADMIMTLVQNGAHLDFRVNDQKNSTPLHLAATNNKCIALRTMVNLGGWVNCPDSQGLTPLYYACKEGFTESILRLLAFGANTEIYDTTGKGPMHLAVMNNYEPSVALLIDFGAQINAANTLGNTPLHLCATCNSVELANWLLMRGANRTLKNKSGQTPEVAANTAGNLELASRISTFQDSHIVPPPPKMIFDKGMNPDNILKNLSAYMNVALKPYKEMRNAINNPATVVHATPIADQTKSKSTAATISRQNSAQKPNPRTTSSTQDQSENRRLLQKSGSALNSDGSSEDKKKVAAGKSYETVSSSSEMIVPRKSSLVPILSAIKDKIIHNTSPILELDCDTLLSGLNEMEMLLDKSAKAIAEK